MKQFTKNDEGFICANCGKTVLPLKYSSRDHCPYCLCSLHVDIFPGDRANDCKGLLKPMEITPSGKKGFIINYKCTRCGKLHNNTTATDDEFDAILSLTNGTYLQYERKLLNTLD